MTPHNAEFKVRSNFVKPILLTTNFFKSQIYLYRHFAYDRLCEKYKSIKILHSICSYNAMALEMQPRGGFLLYPKSASILKLRKDETSKHFKIDLHSK